MPRLLFCSTVATLAVALLAAPAAAAPGEPPPRLSARSAVLVDWQTGQVLYQKNAFQRRPPASTTKVLTALVALERGRLDDAVRISRRAAGTGGSSMYLRAGEKYTLHDLLHGLLLNSGNDAAVAIAEHIAGSVEGFATVMNRRARELGAHASHFVNPHGLHHPAHYSTAYDLALITRHALRQPVFAAVVARPAAELHLEESGRTLTLRNTNRLLWLFEGADGVKTGTTSAAGACLVSSATRKEQKLVAVVLGAGQRWGDSTRLLQWGFDNFRLVELARRGDILLTAGVAAGREGTVPVVAGGDLALVMPRQSQERPQIAVRLGPPLVAPVQAGQVVGVAAMHVRGEQRGVVPLVAGLAVHRRGPLGAAAQWLLPAVYRFLEAGLY